jgi:Secretion system C-terminal sorting domain
MKIRFLHTVFFFLLYLLSVLANYAQPLVTNDGLDLTIQNGLTATIQGAFTNQTHGASLGAIDNAGIMTLTGDWDNKSANGVFSNNTHGHVKFIGTAAQALGTTSATGTDFYDLTANNSFASTAITLGQPATVANQLTLTLGHIVTTSANILTLGTAALAPTGMTDNSFVKGPMKHSKSSAGAHTKLFPVGKGAFLHQMELNVTHSDAVATTYQGEYIAASATALGWTLPATLKYVSAKGYWDITKGGAGTVTTSSVKLYYIASDNAPAAVDLRVARGTASPWINEGGVGSANNVGDITSTVPFTSFGHFSLADVTDGLSPLPIELLSFYAKPNGAVVNLKWVTASEINNDFFTIERTSDGINFEFVGTEKGAGNSTSILNYSLTDKAPLAGISYYRLKQTDFDGKYVYSDLKMVSFGNNEKFSFSIYPNPNDGSVFNLEVSSDKDEEVLVVVTDMLGSEIYSKVFVNINDGGKFVQAIDPNQKLVSGVYMITATSNNRIYNKRLVVN